MLSQLYSLARSWKSNQPLLDKAFSARELQQLENASRYPEFVASLKQSELQNTFFEWILRDGNESIPFIEFPEVCERIIQARLSGRISGLRRIGDKILALPFEGQYRSIMDPQLKITFRGNYTLTVEEIFEIFARKEVEVGNLEYMQDGIVNWNIHKLAYWDADLEKHIPIDISKENWWEEMPLLETLSRKEVFKRYGHRLKAREWIAAPVATRGNPNLDFNETHAYLEIVIPRKEGDYAVYNFGKLATVYPANTLDRLKMLTKTVHGTIAFPDDTSYYTHRQRGFHPFVIDAKQGQQLMRKICGDIHTSRAMNLSYQIQSENCAKWVFHTLEAVLGEVPDFFRMQLLDTEPGGVIKSVFYWIKMLPQAWQVPVLTFFHIPLGAHRTLWIQENGEWVPKSLSRHSFFRTGQVYLPALLVHLVMRLKIPIFEYLKVKPRIMDRMIKFWRNITYLKFFLRNQGSFFTPIL